MIIKIYWFNVQFSDLHSQIQVINRALPIISQQSSSTENMMMYKTYSYTTEIRTDGYH